MPRMCRNMNTVLTNVAGIIKCQTDSLAFLTHRNQFTTCFWVKGLNRLRKSPQTHPKNDSDLLNHHTALPLYKPQDNNKHYHT